MWKFHFPQKTKGQIKTREFLDVCSIKCFDSRRFIVLCAECLQDQTWKMQERNAYRSIYTIIIQSQIPHHVNAHLMNFLIRNNSSPHAKFKDQPRCSRDVAMKGFFLKGTENLLKSQNQELPDCDDTSVGIWKEEYPTWKYNTKII